MSSNGGSVTFQMGDYTVRVLLRAKLRQIATGPTIRITTDIHLILAGAVEFVNC